jgi:hypothetical protein
MASAVDNIFSTDDIQYLIQLPEVAAARVKLDTYASNGMIYFSITLTDSIRQTIYTHLGLDLSSVSEIPMRWIKGDTAPHVDVGRSSFENTYLVYLNDSPGQFVIDDASYPISANTGYVFNEGVLHKTMNTGVEPRLLLGPMNELAQPVGSPLNYYPTETDALNYTNTLGSSGSYIVGSGGPFGGFTSWRIASNSSGSSSQALVYPDGSVLNNDGTYYLYPSAPCFLEGTKILCLVDDKETYVPVEDIKKDTLVKTSRDGYKKVVLTGKGSMSNPGTSERIENRLYKCSKENYPELSEDIYITGCHSILVDNITDKQREETIKHLGKIFITDKKYRLMACVDERAEPWNSEGTYTIHHFALEHSDEAMNYGVYASGLLVETCCIRFLRDKSNMVISK